ncbi:DNA recombination protein RmuC [Kineococcus sp. R8]|nr:DNA recombination protein RmuC [Kineococcus siccus]
MSFTGFQDLVLRSTGEMARAAEAHQLSSQRHAQEAAERLASAQATALSVVRDALVKELSDLTTTSAALRGELTASAQHARQEQAQQFVDFRDQIQSSLTHFHDELVAVSGHLRRDAADQQERAERSSRESASALAEAQRSASTELQGAVSTRLAELVQQNDTARAELAVAQKAARDEQASALAALRAGQDERLAALTSVLSADQEVARRELKESIATLSSANEAKLEQMRSTVQEKLDATLGERLDSSFKLVTGQLESVHKGLGEMQNLAQGVGSLQRTLTNVKTRGAWAELQLEVLLVDLLTTEQFERQHRINPESSELVDFAVRLPGGQDGVPVWLGIDSKFPMDVYERFQAAWEGSDPVALKVATKALVDRVKAEASSISSKYVNPPHTTDFAVMYLPTEGLFAEVVRQPGLVHDLRTQHRIVVAGPTTLTALLGSLSMGFRTLAIQQRSGEVWKVLGQVKAEFEKSGLVWEKLVKQLDTASRTASSAGTRHRSIERRLRDVQTLPLDGAVIPAQIGHDLDKELAAAQDWEELDELVEASGLDDGVQDERSAGDIRSWARANGYVVGERGRLSDGIRAAYEEAQFRDEVLADD